MTEWPGGRRQAHSPRTLTLSVARAGSALPAANTLELEHAAHRLEHEDVGLSIECFEHAHEVAGACDLRAQAVSERFAVGAVAEVVVAADAGGLGDDFDLTRVACERDQGFPFRVEPVELERLPVGSARVQALERLLGLRKVLGSW